jgi:aryl-alcohol dehydrogenase-like predicted oxidoreductase
MEYVPLGRTGLSVSRLCLGCLSFGDPAWRPWVLDEAAARPFFRRAIEAGINFFDTADMYSLGESEVVTGRLLREMANMEEVVVATKVNYAMTSGPNMGGLSRKHVMQACEASLRRLGVDTIDLYQIHRFDPRTPIDETLAALDLLVRQGKVRYVGASAGPAWEFARALYHADRGMWARFVSMQNHYNLLYREEEREMIPLCLAEGVGVIPFSPLARGRLARPRSPAGAGGTVRDGSDPLVRDRYDSPDDPAVLEALARVAERRGMPPAEIALAWLAGRPCVVAPIVGATKLEHLDTALAALDVRLEEDERRELEAPYRAHEVRAH